VVYTNDPLFWSTPAKHCLSSTIASNTCRTGAHKDFTTTASTSSIETKRGAGERDCSRIRLVHLKQTNCYTPPHIINIVCVTILASAKFVCGMWGLVSFSLSSFPVLSTLSDYLLICYQLRVAPLLCCCIVFFTMREQPVFLQTVLRVRHEVPPEELPPPFTIVMISGWPTKVLHSLFVPWSLLILSFFPSFLLSFFPSFLLSFSFERYGKYE